MRLNEAKEIAKTIGLKMQPFTTRINIAGSIRREKPEVKDIELICLPRSVEGGQVDMFDTSV